MSETTRSIEANHESVAGPHHGGPAVADPHVPSHEIPDPPPRLQQLLGSVIMVLLVLGSMTFFLVNAFEIPIPGLSGPGHNKTVAPPAALAVEIVKDVPNTLRVPEEVRKTLGVKLVPAAIPTRTRPLVLSGSTALDPTRVTRIRARFAPAEVVKLREVPDHPGPSGESTPPRQLRSGDWVKKGDLLGVFYSVDVGSKKNDLIDALVQLKLDDEILKRAEKSRDAVPEVFLLNARRNVEGDRNAIARAMNTLKTWNIPEEDIQAVENEAEEISKRGGKRDRSKNDLWPRVELRAPDDGVIVERNVALHEIVVDPTINLFQIAKVDRLQVVANAPEDELQQIQSLKGERRAWTIKTLNGETGDGLRGPISDIGQMIDVNQHTALIKGYIDNPDGRLLAGQFISAIVELPAPADIVEVPTSAIVDDGRQAILFVQGNPAQPDCFTLKRVEVTRRFEKTAFVKTKLSEIPADVAAAEKELGLYPRQPLHPGERVLLSGALELKKELEDQADKAGK